MLANFILPPANSTAVRNGAVVPLHYKNGGGDQYHTWAYKHTSKKPGFPQARRGGRHAA